MLAPRSALIICLVVLCSYLWAPNAAARDDYFEIQEIASEGRSVAAKLAELNGDGNTDLFVVALKGVGLTERREIRVYLADGAGHLPATPNHVLSVPRWSAVYDVADVRPETPGEELVVLRPDRVSILSLARPEERRWDLEAPGPSTLGLADDERGFEPFPIVYREFGSEPWLLVPQIGKLTALAPSGELRAQVDLQRRANYFIIPSTGLVALESDFQIFLDVPKLTIGDVDGDGRSDIVSSTRHEIRVFLQRELAGFDSAPSRTYPLGFVTPRDHIRGTGGVTSEVGDIDGDGRLDLLISHVQGGFQDASTTIYIYMNRDGTWNLDLPDETLSTDASLVSNALVDLDNDGRSELLRVEFKLSVLEFVELLLSREMDISVAIHRYAKDRGFGREPWIRKKLSLPFSFETFRLKGFIPTANVDINGDGLPDFVLSGGGEALEIYLGGPRGPFDRRALRQPLETNGVIHWGDLDHDELPDFVIFDPHNFDVPIRVGRNLGRLPATRPALLAEPASGGR